MLRLLITFFLVSVQAQDTSSCNPCPDGYCVNNNAGVSVCRTYAQRNQTCNPTLSPADQIRCADGLICNRPTGRLGASGVCTEDCSRKNCSDYCVLADDGTAHCRTFAKRNQMCHPTLSPVFQIRCGPGLTCNSPTGRLGASGICIEDCSLKNCSDYCVVSPNGTALCRTYARRNEFCRTTTAPHTQIRCADGLTCGVPNGRRGGRGICMEDCSKKNCSDYCYNNNDGTAHCGVYVARGERCYPSATVNQSRCAGDLTCKRGVCTDSCDNSCNYDGWHQTCENGRCVCGIFCPMIYFPVCGSDGKIYGNACVLGSQTCETRGRVVAAPNEHCGLVACGDGPLCNGQCITLNGDTFCRPYAEDGEQCNPTLSPRDARHCRNGSECVRNGGLLGSSGVCRKILPCNQTCTGYCVTSDQNATEICKQYAQKGESCNHSLPPAYASLCHRSLVCVTSGAPGSSGVCRERASCSASWWARNEGKWQGFSTSANFGTIFNLNAPSIGTLVAAVKSPANDAKHKLAREAVAALLNSAHSSVVGYPYSQQQIIDLVQTTWNLDRNQLNSLTDTFEDANEKGDCPL